jgi:hypothetical protein
VCYAYKIIGGKNVVAKRKKEGDTSDDPKYEDIPAADILKHKGLMKVDGFGFGCVLTRERRYSIRYLIHGFYIRRKWERTFIFAAKRRTQDMNYSLTQCVLCGHKGEVNYNIRGG